MKLYSAKECAKALDMKYDAFLRRVRLGEFKVTRVGYAVTMTHKQVVAASKKVLNAHH